MYCSTFYAFKITSAYWSEKASDVPSLYAGWKIEVCVSKTLLDCSRFGFQWINAAPYKINHDADSVLTSSSGLGPQAWTLSPDQEVFLRKENGAKRENPPLHQITQCLSALSELGYSVTACNSMVFGIGCNAHITWFLKKM